VLKKRGFPIVVSAPSGTGKTTICTRVVNSYPGVKYSVSATTRPQREGEVAGENYHFLDKETFLSWTREGKLCEWALVHGQYYGTPKAQLEDNLSQGFKVVMDLDVNGGEAVGKLYPDAVLVYLLPPSGEALRERITGRGTESREVIQRRLEDAQEELKRAGNYEYLIVNETVEKTVEVLKSILTAEERRAKRQSLPELLAGLEDLNLDYGGR
jgi:guanylate kinase